ncbi:MAG TPA: hypothetical protein VF476_14930 [Chitinophagaceae bacterium]
MKKWLIGSLVGAILVFLWQFLSWSLLGIHNDAMKYSASQDSIISYLSATLKEDGSYRLPSAPPGTSESDKQEVMQASIGKPWAAVIYHKELKVDMTMNMIRGFLVDLVLVILLIYVLTRAGTPLAVKVFAGSIAVGLFTLLWGPYTAHIWFQIPMEIVKGDLIDAIAAWGLCGIWLGWWLNRK